MLPVNVSAAVMAMTCSPTVIQFGYVVFRELIISEGFPSISPRVLKGYLKPAYIFQTPEYSKAIQKEKFLVQ